MSELMIDFGTLQALQCLGLVLPNEMTQITQNPSGDSFALTYFDKRIVYKPSNDTVKTITFPSCYEFSISGQQILKHLNPVYNENY